MVSCLELLNVTFGKSLYLATQRRKTRRDERMVAFLAVLTGGGGGRGLEPIFKKVVSLF
jgi:hypothetical protein